MVQCAAINCSNRPEKTTGVSFFGFPKDKKLRQAWLCKLKRKNYFPKRHARLCSDHFEEVHLKYKPWLLRSVGFTPGKQELLPGAVPTIFCYKRKADGEEDGSTALKKKKRGAYLKREHGRVLQKLADIMSRMPKSTKFRKIAVKLKKTHKHKTNQLQKHFPGGKPTDRISDPVPAAPTTSETYKSARRTRARHPSSERLASKRRKTLKDIASACTPNERADNHSSTSVQPGYGHQNKDAFTVLRLYKRSPLDFGADAKTSSPCAVQKMFVQQLLVVKVELPKQDNWSPSSDQKPPQIKWEQEDPDITEVTFSPVLVKSEDDEEKPQPSELLYKQRPQIKEEQEEADINEFVFNPVPVKGEDEEEKPQFSQLHHSRNDENTDSVGSNPVPVKDEEEKPQFSQLHHSWNDESTDSVGSNPDRCLKSDPEDKHSESSETDVSDGNWEETSAAQPDHFPASGVRHGSPQRPSFDENPFSCSVCVQCFRYGPILHDHDDTHTGDKPFRCNICKAAFGQRLFFVRHMKIHTGETLFSFYD